MVCFAGRLPNAADPRPARTVDACCETKTSELAALRQRQGRVLVAVLVVNAVMFGVEFGAGLLAGSTALLADSLDMLGDALVYGFSLYVLQRSAAWRARAALAKGLVMAAFGLGVLVEAALRLRAGEPPMAPAMATIGTLALLANAFCFALLWRHRADDINLRSTWLCSRNDLVANGAVLLAAGCVAWTGSLWPDLVVGAAIATLFLRTASSVLRESVAELSRARSAALEGAR
ncbi:MAG: cation diffusion facilitator family transporter [Myxococcota bacterium]